MRCLFLVRSLFLSKEELCFGADDEDERECECEREEEEDDDDDDGSGAA